MDTSETYIKMSEQAMKHLPACQAPYDDGEWVTYRHDRFLTEAIKNTVLVGDYLEPERCYWETWVLCGTDGVIHLLQQDQLQAMVDWTPQMLWEDLSTSDEYGERSYCPFAYHEVKSWEQLWLAIVMHEKYGKRWTGEEWVSDKPPDDCPFATCDRDVVRDFCPQGCQPYQIFKRAKK